LSIASATPAAYGAGKSTSAPEKKGVGGFRRLVEWLPVADMVNEADTTSRTSTLMATYTAVVGVKYESQQAPGNVAKVILETATRRQGDAIILGRHETSGWKRRLYDRTVRVVIAQSLLPILLIKCPLLCGV
jgi:nucleotide-binding universal stress UspA family protein